MLALLFRSQTTKGIWMAKCNEIDPCTIVMDLEGTDGRERGEVLVSFIYFYFKCVYWLIGKQSLEMT